ncbi:MAG: hypothetical protein J6T10_08640 [Methanobrevibacter sp.]|nr:hypothetical protein [Methanobrevibacter sp.]
MALNQVRVTGNDTIYLGSTEGVGGSSDNIVKSFADGDYARVTFPNDIMNFTIGKNRNMIAAYNAMGTLAELELRLLRGSYEDAWLNGRFPTIDDDQLSFKYIFAEIHKDLGKTDNSGSQTAKISETYVLNNGIITKAPEIISNVSGSTDQGVVIWQIRFASFKREVTGIDGTELK